ncbi:predicted protein [Nematostella vectensis]|uniref:Zinc finger HIT domain-containing protein 2 n=1 Tax=Nematostella vectensis TaxID=45351 RepID=A7S2D2_NEMVE|nr:predicted protein [Nematostella vectensis]|eukprot:XP_001634185.1 predicted protein [Nematostella vectensis]
MDALKLDSNCPDDPDRIIEMLKRLEDDGKGEGDEEGSGLEERLRDIDLDRDPDVLWDALGKAEQQGFLSALKSGKFSHSITLLEPWWKPEIKKHVEVLPPLEESNLDHHYTTSLSKTKSKIPSLIDKVPPLMAIIKTAQPNPAVKFSIVDVLYSYAYTMRLYNFTPQDDPRQASETFLALSSVISKNITFQSTDTVAHTSLNNSMEQKDLFNSREFSCNILLDVVEIINGFTSDTSEEVSFVSLALSDCHRLLSRGLKALRQEQGDKDLEKKLWLAKKKVDFLLSWSNENIQTLQSVASFILAIHHQELLSCKMHLTEKQSLEKRWRGPNPPPRKPLIEEL